MKLKAKTKNVRILNPKCENKKSLRKTDLMGGKGVPKLMPPISMRNSTDTGNTITPWMGQVFSYKTLFFLLFLPPLIIHFYQKLLRVCNPFYFIILFHNVRGRLSSMVEATEPFDQ